MILGEEYPKTLMSIRLGRHITSNRKFAFEREWLVTNGIGGYAMGTIGGARTRRYHGLLVAALSEPIQRHLLLAALDVWVAIEDRRIPLTTAEWSAGVIFPDGYHHLEAFWLERGIPVFRWGLGLTCIEQRIWMQHEQNTTYITWHYERGRGPITLFLKPLVTYRSHHDLSKGGRMMTVTSNTIAPWPGGLQLNVLPDKYLGQDTITTPPQPFHIYSDRGLFYTTSDWWWNFHLAEEKSRGLPFQEDLFQVGTIEVELEPGDTCAIAASSETMSPYPALEALQMERERQRKIIATADIQQKPEWIQQTLLAADQFLVHDRNDETPHIISGYPWYGVWGRSTMSSLTGLTATLGRSAEAEAILRSFGKYLDRGMLPNVVADHTGDLAYNSIDATLWYFIAVWRYLQDNPQDNKLREDLYPLLVDILEWHSKGTRYQIAEDPEDNLLYGGEEGMQLTWMDVKINDYVVTPRTGKDVEVNALWYNALRVMQHLAGQLGHKKKAKAYQNKADHVQQNFQAKFWAPDYGYLYDVIDIPDSGNDPSLRPNQLLAISLPFPVIEDQNQQQQIVDVCARHLLTSFGLRTLSQDHIQYVGSYQGPQFQRDNALHQGTVWAWLIGPFVSAHLQAYGDVETAMSFLRPFEDELFTRGIGSISEIFDGNVPHHAKGAPAFAWSVAEVLHAWRELERYEQNND